MCGVLGDVISRVCYGPFAIAINTDHWSCKDIVRQLIQVPFTAAKFGFSVLASTKEGVLCSIYGG